MRSITIISGNRAARGALPGGAVLIAMAFWVLPALALTAEVSVDCSNPKAKMKTIADALAKLDKQAENTIHVAGTCNESLEIIGYENLSLIADEGASINDPTPSIPDDNAVVFFYDSGSILLEGFSIHGGIYGTGCSRVRYCEIKNNTIEGASEAGVAGASNTNLYLVQDTIQNNPGYGVHVAREVSATIYGGMIEGNMYGIVASPATTLTFFRGPSGGPVTIQDNAVGVFAGGNSTVMLYNGTAVIASNTEVGLKLESGSVAAIISNNEITGGSQGAVVIGDLSLARFSPGSTISGGPPAVNCVGKHSVAAGDLAGIGTNCAP